MERNFEREGNEKGNRPGFEAMTLLNFGARLRSRLIDSAYTTKQESKLFLLSSFCFAPMDAKPTDRPTPIIYLNTVPHKKITD
jgi:hypothetical protein